MYKLIEKSDLTRALIGITIFIIIYILLFVVVDLLRLSYYVSNSELYLFLLICAFISRILFLWIVKSILRSNMEYSEEIFTKIKGKNFFWVYIILIAVYGFYKIQDNKIEKINRDYEESKISIEKSRESINKSIKRVMANNYNEDTQESMSNNLGNENENLSESYFKFRTKGLPKSKGLDWQIKLHNRWVAIDGDRPNVVKKFLKDGKDEIAIVLLTNDLNVSDDDITKSIEGGFCEKMNDKIESEIGKIGEVSNLRSKSVKFDGLKGCLREYELKKETNYGIYLYTIVTEVQLYYNRHIYSVSCTTTSLISMIEARKLFQENEDEFADVFYSIVINDQWK